MTVSGESSKTRWDIEADATQPSVPMSEPTRHHSPDPRAMLWVRVDPLGNTTFAHGKRMIQSKTETTRAWRLFRSRRCESCRGVRLWPDRPRTALFRSTSGRTKRRRARASADLVYKTLAGKGLSGAVFNYIKVFCPGFGSSHPGEGGKLSPPPKRSLV